MPIFLFRKAFRKFVTSPTPYIIIKVLWRGKSSPYYIYKEWWLSGKRRNAIRRKVQGKGSRGGN